MVFDVSKDRRYLQLENMVVDLETGIKFTLDSAHPAFICEMFKNQFAYSYKHKLIENNELFRKMKQLIYPLISHDKGIVSEYEVRYGMNLISESSETFSYSTYRTIEESWDFVKTKMLDMLPITPNDLVEGWLGDTWDSIKSGASAAWDKTKEVAGKVWDSIKDAASWILNKGLPWFFEKLEGFLLNPVTIGVEVALTAIGVGKIAGAILWGVLGIWKIYQLATGKIKSDIWSYLDIGVCLLGLLATGGAAKALKAGIKSTGRSIAKLAKLPGIKQLIQLLAKGVSFIGNMIMKPIQWLTKTFGGPKINEMVNMAKNKLDDVVKKLTDAFNSAKQGPGIIKTAKQGIKTDITNPLKTALKGGKTAAELERAAFKGTLVGTSVGLGMMGIHKYADNKQKEAEKKEKETNKAMVDFASNDETMQQAASSEMQGLLNQFKTMDNQ
jgi:hypothetical protein